MILRLFLILIALGVSLLNLGCVAQSTTSSLPKNPYPAPEKTPSKEQYWTVVPVPLVDAPLPDSGKASISGVLYSNTVSRVLPGTMFYLTHAVGDDKRRMPTWLIGPQDGTGDIQGITNEYGHFFINNLTPGNYYLIVWAPYDWIPVVNSIQDPNPRLIELAPNERKSLGIAYVPWP